MNLDDVFKSIYSAIVEAQNTVEQHYLGEIQEDYFDKDGNPITFPVSLPVGEDGTMQTVPIPLITLVPHWGLAVREVGVSMRVALTDGDEASDKTRKSGKLRKLVSNLSNRNTQMAQLKVVFDGRDPPEGLARIKDSLTKLIPN